MANRNQLTLLFCVCLLLLMAILAISLMGYEGRTADGTEGIREMLTNVIQAKFGLLAPSEESNSNELEAIRESLRSQRALIEEIACKQNGIGARGGFCLTPESVDVGGNSWWDPKLAKNLEGLFAGKRVGDLGAGLGWYGRYWMRKTEPVFFYGKSLEATQFTNTSVAKELEGMPQEVTSWKGYDGAGNVEVVTSRWVRFLDLTEEHDLPEKFDWVISLEVGEHIPPPFESVFVGNLVRHSCIGIVLSWAVEGQGGHFHVNNHNNDYVKDLMKQHGFKNDIIWENKLRENVVLSYFSNTLMVFTRSHALDHPKCKRSV